MKDKEWLRESLFYRLDDVHKEKFEAGHKIYIHPRILMMKRNEEELLKMSDAGIPWAVCQEKDEAGQG